MRGDASIYEPFQKPAGTVGRVAGQALRRHPEASHDASQHRLGDCSLLAKAGARTFGVDDDPEAIVDEIIGVIVECGVDPFACDPGGLRVGLGNLLARLTIAAPVAASICTSLVGRGIENGDVLPDGTGGLICILPAGRCLA
jgi:hypothetical protein